jgi:transcriptional regulator with XRE-family HTH domain
MLSTALDFAGYDTKYDWSDEKHSGNRAAVIFEEVMIWLWGGYPKPVEAGITRNDFLNKYLYRDGEKTPFCPLSVSGRDQWIKEKETDGTMPVTFTLEDIAQAVGVGRSTVRKWETGMIKNMGRDKIAALAKVLQMNPVEFVPGDARFSDHQNRYTDPEDLERLEALHQDQIHAADRPQAARQILAPLG